MGYRLRISDALRRPRRLLLFFLLLTVAPAAGLVYAGWALVGQERDLESERIQKRRDQAADLIVVALKQEVAAIHQQLADPSSWPSLRSADTRLVVLGVRARLSEAPWALFLPDEEAEYRSDHAAAIRKFRELAASPDAAVKAGALLRLARNLSKAKRSSEALDVYAQLAKLHDVAVADGLPADLVARRMRCDLLSQLGRHEDRRIEAERLRADLDGGHWSLDEPTHSLYTRDVADWLDGDEGTGVRADRETIDAAVQDVWVRWDASQYQPSGFAGHEPLDLGDGPGVLLWRANGSRLVLLVARQRYLQRTWLARLAPLLESQGVSLSVGEEAAAATAGSGKDTRSIATIRPPSATDLPWTLRVATADPKAEEQSRTRGRLLLSGLGLLLVVVSAGSCVVAYAIHRELNLARLQSDFVAAVSHEFRTPLTSLRQVTEILTEGRVAERATIGNYYQKQLRATDRLQRLVETLLDFGRMEAGARAYRLRPLELCAWIRGVVDDFQGEAASAGHAIELQTNGHPCTVDADPEALAHAVRNLLDNAVKYSPDRNRVWVDVAHSERLCTIRIRDEGVGIPRDEQADIWRKFVRGAASKSSAIKGTGVGLAIVRQIVEAHHGQVHLDSQPGKGSTFTVFLPESAEST